MTKSPVFLLIAATLIFSSCETHDQKKTSIRGIWKSIGYGEIIEIDSLDYAIYDITKISCLPSQQGKIEVLKKTLELQNDTLSISHGLNVYYYTRLENLPDLCSQNLSEEQKNDPVYNFEVLASTIGEHFDYFEMNKIDWNNMYAASKSKVTTETTAAELYWVMEDLISSLNDNHGYIEPTDEVYEAAMKLRPEPEETENLKEYGDFEIAQIAAEYFLDENMTKDSWLVNWGKTKGNIGYIQLKAMWLFGDLNLPDSLVQKNGFVSTYVDAFTQISDVEYVQAEVKGISLIMDQIMEDLSHTDFMIIDVRFNGGGQDAVGLEVLRRFNGQRIQVASKTARDLDNRTKEVPVFVDHNKELYTNPVYLLTSQQSASATDFMALASLELENVKRIGSHTNGALSDALERTLPNGWYFSTSNETYLDMKGRSFESLGIPVDYELNYPDDRQAFFRSVADDLQEDKQRILEACEIISEKQ